MKLLGLIGGMNWESTIEYYKVINQMVNERFGRWNSALLLLYSINFEEIIPLQNNNQWGKITEIVGRISMKLESAGCAALVICSNTMHKVADQVQEKITIPLINVIDETAKEIKSNKIKNIGLLGTKFTMEEEFYTNKLQRIYDLNPIVPDDRDRLYIHEAIYKEFAQGVFLKKTKQQFLKIIKKLEDRGSEGIILGCTEIPLLIKQEDVDIPLFDTLKIHLKSALNFCFTD
jgi:aspartate racemase